MGQPVGKKVEHPTPCCGGQQTGPAWGGGEGNAEEELCKGIKHEPNHLKLQKTKQKNSKKKALK